MQGNDPLVSVAGVPFTNIEVTPILSLAVPVTVTEEEVKILSVVGVVIVMVGGVESVGTIQPSWVVQGKLSVTPGELDGF